MKIQKFKFIFLSFPNEVIQLLGGSSRPVKSTKTLSTTAATKGIVYRLPGFIGAGALEIRLLQRLLLGGIVYCTGSKLFRTEEFVFAVFEGFLPQRVALELTHLFILPVVLRSLSHRLPGIFDIHGRYYSLPLQRRDVIEVRCIPLELRVAGVRPGARGSAYAWNTVELIRTVLRRIPLKLL